jgi:predicted metal-dependent enzyme (double-stranded beta helix superfamily)
MTFPREQAPALKAFVTSLESLMVSSDEQQPDFWLRLGQAMKKLLAQDDWLPASLAQPHPQYYQQFCLHVDPQERFSVVSFVWGPGQFTPIHDHTVWGVIGMLRGAEVVQDFVCEAGGVPVATGDRHTLAAGDVAFVSPTIGDVHKVSNAFDDRVSISIHAYGGNIGKIDRHVFPPEGGQPKSFVSGYSLPATA